MPSKISLPFDGILKDYGYTFIDELGRGASSVVYLAKQDCTGTLVAIKIILPRDSAEEVRVKREIDNMKALNHINVVHILDSKFFHGTFFLMLEYCNAGSVEKFMERRGGKLKIDEAMKIILPALDGLEYAHNVVIPQVMLTGGSYEKVKGLVHRDLKPSNLLLTDDGKITKIGDFGLAKAYKCAGLSGETPTGAIAGTWHFMSRMQVYFFKYAEPDVDVWAMAANLYFMLTGAYTRDFSNDRDPWQTILETDSVPILSRGGDIPKKMAMVIDEALRDRDSFTFKTAVDFKRALESTV